MFLFFFSFLHNRAKVYRLKIVVVRGSERMVAGDEDAGGRGSGSTASWLLALPALEAERTLQGEGVGMA